MKATANAPVVVASSSNNTIGHRTNNRNQPNISTPGPRHLHFPGWTISPIPCIPLQTRHINPSLGLNTMPPFPPNRPVNSAPNPSNKRAQVPTDANNRTNTPHGSVGNNSQASSQTSSPRRRRNDEPNQQGSRNAQNTQKKPNTQQDNPQPGRVLVTGYPNYTQPHDLLEVFTKFGEVRIDKCNRWSATLTYSTDEQAKSAIGANKRLHIYGHFLCVRPYSAKLKAEEGPLSPKREFPKSKQKKNTYEPDLEIEPIPKQSEDVIIDPKELDLSGDFNSQLDMIMAAIRLNQDDINKISILYRDLEATFHTQWPGCKAVPFGSITTGLGIKTSDADCFISLPPQFRSPHGNHVAKARRLLMMCPQIFTEILAIPRANTPIVKFYHAPTDTNCDLTFKTPLGAQNSRLVAFLLHADPRITPMAVVIKYWAKVHELSGTGKLTNYALTLMIIFYLQQQPMSVLPSVEWLQRDRANDVYVDFWNTGFMSNPNFLPPVTNTASISEMLGGFFEYYSIFNFEEMVVCPFLGAPIKKEAFKDTATLPQEFSLYKKNVLTNLVMPVRHQTSFCVQDPFEQCHNVASTITSKLALDIKTFFKFAASAYEKEKLNNCEDFLKIILLERPKLLRGKAHPEYRVNLFPRIINTIISFDWKAVVRDLVVIIFEKMMKIKLGKVEEKVNPDTRKEKEKYMGSLHKAIWRRKKYNAVANNRPDLGIEEKQSLISEELLDKETQPIGLQFQLTLTFCHEPKSAVISIRMGGGDLDAFREFGKFFISVMQNWFTELLKPFSMPNCKDTAAKIAESADDDANANLNEVDSDDEEVEIVLTPSTRAAEEKTVAEVERDVTEDNSESNEETPADGTTEAKTNALTSDETILSVDN